MKICDRHFYLDGSSVPSVDVLVLKIGGETVDLCDSCREAVKEFIFSPETVDGKRKRRSYKPVGED